MYASVLSCAFTLFLCLQIDSPSRRLREECSHRNVCHTEIRVSFNHTKPMMNLHKCNTIKEDTMYAFGNEIYDAIGETELQQYIRFSKFNPKFKFIMNQVKLVEPPAGYNYYVKALSSTDILIEERNGKTPTGGGSSFLVRSDSVSTQICHYDDFFNGTYVAHCPLPECTCRNISVWLQYFNYTAYTGNHLPIKKLLWRQSSCNLHNGDAGLNLTRRKMSTSTNGKNIVTWYLKNRTRIATSLIGEEYREMNKSELCGCIHKLRKLFCIGASHMRYKCDYFMSLCYNLPSDVPIQHSTLNVGNVHYLSKSKFHQFPAVWEKCLQQENLGRRDVVVIQTGAHDMAQLGIQGSMASVPEFVRVLGDLQKKSLKYGFRLLFVTTLPFPETDKRETKGSRNNFALAAFNRRLKTDLLSKKVNVFDEFSVLLAQQDINSCGCHYICRYTKNNMSYISGKVGMIAASMMLSNEIC